MPTARRTLQLVAVILLAAAGWWVGRAIAAGRVESVVQSVGDAGGSGTVVAAGAAPRAGSAPDVERRVIAPPPEGEASAVDVGAGGVHGRVLDPEGRGFAGARVVLQPASGNPLAGRDPMTVVTAAGGAYRFAGVIPGSYRVTATSAGMQEGRASGTIAAADGADVEIPPIRLAVGYALHGVVVGPGDVPVAGAAVRVRSGSSGPRFRASVSTAADGRFVVPYCPPGPLRLAAAATGFQRQERSDVDPAAGDELVVRLLAGMTVSGVVVDRAAAPVARFAAKIRRVGPLDPGNLGSMSLQLRRRIAALRTEAAVSGLAADERSARLALAMSLQERLDRVRREADARSHAVPDDLGPVTARPGGRFAFDGLDTGIYTVDIASPDHRFVRVGPIEVRSAVPVPALRVEVHAGWALRGAVRSKHDGSAVAGAEVELRGLVAVSAEQRERRRSLYPWVFARPGPLGVAIMRTRAAADGSFAFTHAAPRRYFLTIRHPRFADHDTAPFFLQGNGRELRVEIGARAVLTGRVRGIPPQPETPVEVLVLGGHGVMRTVAAGADGTYRFAALQPGSYIVRAYVADARDYVRRQLGSVFAPSAAVADPVKTVARDVTLRENERRSFDLDLDLPPVGTVTGRVTLNGLPASRGRVLLRPIPGAAPHAGGVSPRSVIDEHGAFTMRDVPAGEYTLRIRGTPRQELHTERVKVVAGETVTVRTELRAGGLKGTVVSPDEMPAAEIRGTLYVLPGVEKAPADLPAYRREHRVHRVRVRNGEFAGEGLTVGPALVVLVIRDRAPVTARTVIVAGATAELSLTAGRR